MTRTPGSFIAALVISVLAFLAHSQNATAASIYIYVDPDSGNDLNDGRVERPVRTIQRALELADPGEKVRLTTGVYRENVVSVRGGYSSAPITIEPALGALPIIDGRGTGAGPLFRHSYITMRGIEVRNMRFGVRIEGARNVVIRDNVIHNVGSECLRIRYGATRNSILNNNIFDCGMTGNGEGIYVGTAPEQQARTLGGPDSSTYNLIQGNDIYRVTEGIDLKENASYTTIIGNRVHNARDPDSGGINVRSNDNELIANSSNNNAGSGFRLGGDLINGVQFGLGNRLRDNTAADNAYYGYKVMATPQDIDCSNRAFRNGVSSFTAGDGCE